MIPTFKPAPLGDKQWKDLQKLDPQDVCRRTSVTYDESGFYSLTFMNRPYTVYVNEERVEGPEDGDVLAEDIEFVLLLLTYLLSGQDVPRSGTWISEKDIPGGNMFFRGPHALPVQPLITKFGADPNAYSTQGTALGGSPVEYGDVAFEFLSLNRIPLVCILWVEDDEFPARVNFLFDPSIESQLPLDVILALIRSVVKLVSCV